MGRSVGGVIVGMVVWFVVATLGNLALRAAWPDYALVEKAMMFTLDMQFARLVLGAVSSLAAGYACAALSRRTLRPAMVLAALMLVIFLPVHYALRAAFPWWYHVVFLLSLMVLVPFGATLYRRLGVAS